MLFLQVALAFCSASLLFRADALLTEHLNPDQEARCLNCIRNVSSIMNIDTSKRCENYFCGPYQLSYTYWSEAGKPGNNQGARDYEKCARDKTCAEQTVRAYFKKYKRDCNGDGIIDCRDMAAMHKGGPQSCNSDWFYKSRYWLAFNKTLCMTNPDSTELGADSISHKQINLNEQGQQTRQMKNQSLTPECLDCICDAVSGCNTSVNNCGSGTVCGPFAISQAYWKDGRRPGASWTACARTKECSSVAMKNYMEKYTRDCNGDGFITCEDYAAIHRRGPQACSNRDLFKDHYWNKFLACRANQKPVKDVNMVKVNESPDDLMTLTKLSGPADPTLLTSTSTAAAVAATNQTPITTISFSSTSTTSPTTTTTPSTTTITASQPPSSPVSDIGGGSYDMSSHYRPDRNTPTTSTTINYSPTTSGTSAQQSSVEVAGKDENHDAKFQISEQPTYELKSMVLDVKDDKSENAASKRNKLPPLNAYGHVPVSNLANQFNQYETRKPILYESTTSSKPTKRPDYVVDASDLSTPVSSFKHSISHDYYQPLPKRHQHQHQQHQQPQQSTHTREPPIFSTSRGASSPTRWQSAEESTLATVQPTPSSTSSTTPRSVIIPDSSVSTVIVPNMVPVVPVADHQPINIRPPVVSGEDDYPVAPEYPYHSQNSDLDRTNFDRVVNNIVTNPDFSKSHPPVPEISVILAKEEESYSTTQQQPQQVNRNNFSKTPNLSSKTSGSDLTSQSTTTTSGSSIKRINTGSAKSTTTILLQPEMQQENQANPQPDLTDNLNVSSLFEKGLNESGRISNDCLECICDASSNCDTSVQCISKQREKNRCGLYMISWNQFQDSDISLTSLMSSPLGSSNDESANERLYYDCTTDKLCAERLIHLYIEKYQKDCNGDGKIDCRDIAAIHRVGPDNCNSGKFLSSQYWKDFSICAAERLTGSSEVSSLTTTPQTSTTIATLASTHSPSSLSSSVSLMRRLH